MVLCYEGFKTFISVPVEGDPNRPHHGVGHVFGAAVVPETPQGAEMMKIQSGSSDVPGVRPLCGTYPESSGPLDESFEIK